MTSKRSIFFDEWQACLRAHYIHVIRTNDAVTERTLRSVLRQSGLTDADLQRLVDEAFALGPVDPDDEIRMEPDIAAADELPAEPEALVTDEEAGDETTLPDEIPPDDKSEPAPLDGTSRRRRWR